MRPLLFMILLIAATAPALAGEPPAPAAPREFSVDLWDWTTPCRDLPTFKLWAADLKKIGATRIEFSAPWSVLEPKPGDYDLSFVTDRLAVAKSLGLGVRIRINSYYNGATPAWYAGDFWQDVNGHPPRGTPVPPSICDERFWSRYAPLCTKIAVACKGQDVYLNAFIGIHAELKWSDWWSYDPASLAKWRKAVTDRPAWLRDVVGDADLPDKPPVPPPTRGAPDNSPISKGWIAFREHAWREAIERFTAAVRAGDEHAKLSAPLGESFRRQSAQFSNLDYFGLSRGADQVVHSYDFFWHTKDDASMAAAAVASFRGITGIRDIAFEFDGPSLIQNLGYDEPHQLRIADAAISQGAALKAANYSYDARLPSSWPVLVEFSKRIATTQPIAEPPPPEQTILLFVSKWANYCYREKTEWLHDAQFGAWRMLTSRGLPVRFICEDNFDENLSRYRGLYVAFSPPELMPQTAQAKLSLLEQQVPSIIELGAAPPRPPTVEPTDIFVKRAGPRAHMLGLPLAYFWLRGPSRSLDDDVLDRAIADTWGAAKP